MWWSDGDTSIEGREIQTLISSLSLKELLTGPIDLKLNNMCIDLFLTDQIILFSIVEHVNRSIPTVITK